MTDTGEVRITLEADGPVLIIFFLLICLISIAWQIGDNSRQRRKLAVVAGPNQEARQNRRMFFYTVLIIGLLTLLANYIMGVTSSLAAAHINEVQDPISLLSLPGITASLITVGLYALAILLTASMLARKERLGFPELLADLHDARKFGGLESPRQVAHYQGELEQLRQLHRAERSKAHLGNEFDLYFTAHETARRARLMEQLKFLRRLPDRHSRARSFRRTLFFNYRTTTGKWIVPFALLTVVCLAFAVLEGIAANDGDGDFSLALVWGVAGFLAIMATAAQYFCDVGKVLLESRREYVAQETELECRKILLEAHADLTADAARDAHLSDAAADGWRPVFRIGRWEARRRNAS